MKYRRKQTTRQAITQSVPAKADNRKGNDTGSTNDSRHLDMQPHTEKKRQQTTRRAGTYAAPTTVDNKRGLHKDSTENVTEPYKQA